MKGLWLAAALAIPVGIGGFIVGFRQGVIHAPSPSPGIYEADVARSPAVPASQAHSPTVSLIRYLKIGQSPKLTQDDAGYWNLMVSATSDADAVIGVATVTCTFFDKDNQPVGNSGGSFHNLSPGRTAWQAVPFKAEKPPASASCNFDVAYNSE